MMGRKGLGTLAALALTTILVPPSAAQTLDLHRMEERLERVHGRLEGGATSASVAAELAAIRAAYAERVERLAAELDRADAAVAELALGPIAAERLARARDAFARSHVELLEGLTRLAAAPDLSEVEACLRALEPVADAEKEDLLSAQELPLRSSVGVNVVVPTVSTISVTVRARPVRPGSR